MEPPVDLEKLPPGARRLLDPASPPPMRQMGARGVAPGLKPGDALTVVALLAESDVEEIAAIARATLDKLPAPLLTGALAGALPAGVLGAIAPRYAQNATVMEKILAHASIAPETVASVAAGASEAVAELVATNEERLLAHPAIIERLYMNKATRMSTADRVLELAVRNKIELKGIPAYKEAAAAIGQELIAEASVDPTPDDVLFRETEEVANAASVDPTLEDTHHIDDATGEEVVEDKFLPLHAQLAALTISQKIRRAMLGTAAERLLLVRDSNRLVAQAAIRSPGIQENEVVRISASRNVSEDVLRIIALDREWARSHQIKLNLVQNPRTPFAFAAKLIMHLREHELKALARSKNVTGAVATAARQQLSRRKVD
ncbi:MAG TPA: hypothetical protein VKU41_18350 [Polyangiaceae bacterium]|nr:hypothetical protein [Polyangiaceae bacterium]